VGRTARMGRAGKALTLLTPLEQNYIGLLFSF
jgi:superfamily II DNA/RNA helicase